jgi:hypothetical protein
MGKSSESSFLRYTIPKENNHSIRIEETKTEPTFNQSHLEKNKKYIIPNNILTEINKPKTYGEKEISMEFEKEYES